VSQPCFGVEPCSDGSVVVAARNDVEVRVTRVAAGAAQSSEVVEFVRRRAQSPRVCVAAHDGRGLNLALALGTLPEVEVILMRPEAVARGEVDGAARQEPLAVALASYARRAA